MSTPKTIAEDRGTLQPLVQPLMGVLREVSARVNAWPYWKKGKYATVFKPNDRAKVSSEQDNITRPVGRSVTQRGG
jgi:hypothetical protein